MKPATGMQRRILVMAMAALLPMQAAAFRVDYVAEVTVERNDNVRLDYQDPIAVTIFRPGIGFDASHEGSRVNARVQGRLDYLMFSGADIGNRLDAGVDARLDFSVIPQRLGFSIRDHLTQFPLNPFAPDAPDNRQRLNVFSAGPNLYFDVGNNARGQVEARHVRSNTDITDVYDSRRNAVALRVRKPLSERSSLTFNAEYQTIDFVNDGLLGDYSRNDVHLRYDQAFRGGHYAIHAGWSRLRPEHGGKSRSGPLFRAELSRQLGTRQNLIVRYARQYSDVALRASSVSDFDFNSRSGLGDFDVVLNPFPFREHRLEASWSYSGERFSVDVMPFVSRIRYEYGNFAGHNARGVQAGAGFRINPRLTLGVAATDHQLDYLSTNSAIRTRQYSTFLDYRVSRHIYSRLQVGRTLRADSTFPDARGRQNYLMLTVGYRNH